MTEEEYFRKNYPDSCYGDRPLSPYWDFFQDGVEFGERQSEKKIGELELELTVAKDLHQEETNLHLHAEEYIKSLEKENAELKKWKEDTIRARGNDYMAWSRQNDQLIKAKEIIKRLLSCSRNYPQENADKIQQAEQFLKESE